MAVHEFHISLSSPPDREQLVADVFVGAEQIAELNVQNGQLEVEIYPRQDGSPWILEHEQFVHALSDAKTRLVDRLGEV